jgi:hypothetical protein
MRVNPTYIKAPSITNEVPSKLGLGSMFNTKQKVWTYEFDIDYEGAIDVPTLVNDFDLIPIITKLNETAKFDNPQFLTKNLEKSNIIFMLMDK